MKKVAQSLCVITSSIWLNHCNSLFPKFTQNLLLQFVLIAPDPAIGHIHGRSQALSPLLPNILPSLPFSKMKSLISPECKMHPPLHHLMALCWTCSSSMLMSVILVRQGLHPPLQMCCHLCWVERKNHLLLPAGSAFPKADQFGKILAFSFTVVVKTTVTGFRKRIWVWNCLSYYASKLVNYTTVHFQNYWSNRELLKVENKLGIHRSGKGFRDSTNYIPLHDKNNKEKLLFFLVNTSLFQKVKVCGRH